jgi:nitrate reductase NapE component
MQSIPQQYKTNDQEDNTDDEHAVFDTKQYYQPLDPPAKKKSHVLLYIILLVLMVAVGSAIGYLVWVLKLF